MDSIFLEQAVLLWFWLCFWKLIDLRRIGYVNIVPLLLIHLLRQSLHKMIEKLLSY